jgi:RHS repeat-associated protein
MTEIRRGNGATTSYAYDVRGRITRLRTTVEQNDLSIDIQNTTYRFKTDNSIAGKEELIEAGVQNNQGRSVRHEYQYDGLNRLAEADGRYERGADPTSARQFRQRYAYAANGNLTRKDAIDPASGALDDRWTYAYVNHAVTNIDSSKNGAGRFAMGYDAAGNMIYQADRVKNRQKSMEYDSNNRIREVLDPATNAISGQYWYDDQGFRVRKFAEKEAAGEMRRVEILYPNMYFGVEKQYDSRGAEIADSEYSVNNIYLNGVRIAVVIPTNEARYYLTDQVDSVKVVLDDQAQAKARFEYYPFGETWVTEGEDNHAPKYNSQEYDRETGFYFYNARYYDPEISRFVTADNIIPEEFSTQSWNRYSYVRNNPILYKDPTGHFDIVSGTIEKGDTLRDIAKQVREEYGQYKTDADCMKDILKQNPQIKDADKIYTGKKLAVPFNLKGPKGGAAEDILKDMSEKGQSDDVRKVISLSKASGVKNAGTYGEAFDILSGSAKQVTGDKAYRDKLAFAATAATTGVTKFKNGEVIGKDPLVLPLAKQLGNDKAQHFFYSSYLRENYGSGISRTAGVLRELWQHDRDSVNDIKFNEAGIKFSETRDRNPNATPSSALKEFGIK